MQYKKIITITKTTNTEQQQTKGLKYKLIITEPHLAAKRNVQLQETVK